MRTGGRKSDERRDLSITRNYIRYAEGSVLVETGETKVICTVSVEDKVPPFLRGGGQGWITAEYSMLPRSTQTRNARESSRGKVGGRTHEIQRLIGRSLRSVVDLKALGEKTLWIDCDVIQADGGTRTASITGSFVALVDALQTLAEKQRWSQLPLYDYLAAISVGVVNGTPLLDLDYQEDSSAQVDMNLVMTGDGRFIEVQGTAEGQPFTRDEYEALMNLGEKGIRELVAFQKELLAPISIGGQK